MDPVLGQDVIIQFKKNDEFFNYACATDVRIDFEMDRVPVRTIGDGTWKKPRGIGKAYTVNLSGLIKFDDDTVPHAFDLYTYFDSMTSIDFRLYFTLEDGTTVRIFEGLGLPTSVSLGGGSEGHATGEIVLEGDGAPELRTAIVQCEAEITDGEIIFISGENGFKINALSGGPVYRYDWSIDSGGRTSAFVDGTLPDQFSIGNGVGAVDSEHTLHVWPVCENGFDGEEFTIQFFNLP